MVRVEWEVDGVEQCLAAHAHLPDLAIDIIERRRREWPVDEPVFVSVTGTYLNAHNLRTALREGVCPRSC